MGSALPITRIRPNELPTVRGMEYGMGNSILIWSDLHAFKILALLFE